MTVRIKKIITPVQQHRKNTGNEFFYYFLRAGMNLQFYMKLYLGRLN